MKRRFATLACLVFATLAAVQLGQAQPVRGPQQDETPRGAQPGVPRRDLLEAPSGSGATAVSRREASDRARDTFGGRVLSVRLDGDKWRIRMDEEGTVFSVVVDARSGAVARDAE